MQTRPRQEEERMIFTCSVCENPYNELNGDMDERMCQRCLDTSDMLDDMYEEHKNYEKITRKFSDNVS